MDASIFSVNPCFVCNEETSFDDMVCEEDSFIPIQFKKVNEVFKKLKLCSAEEDDNIVHWKTKWITTVLLYCKLICILNNFYIKEHNINKIVVLDKFD